MKGNDFENVLKQNNIKQITKESILFLGGQCLLIVKILFVHGDSMLCVTCGGGVHFNAG